MMNHPESGFPWILLLRQYLEMTMTNSARIILSDSGLASLRNLIAIRRALDPNFTYSYISKQMGIKTPGQLAELVKGTRKLQEKQIISLVDLLDLPEAEGALLKDKVRLDSGLATAHAEADIPAEARDLNLVLILTVCLYLFKDGQASRQDLIELFGARRSSEIERGLSDLIRNGILVREGEAYRYSDSFPQFLPAEKGVSKRHESDYLKASIQEAQHEVDYHMEHPEQSIFYSGIIPVEYSSYLGSLDFVKQNLNTIQSQIESKDADTLVRFNVQLFPILTRK